MTESNSNSSSNGGGLFSADEWQAFLDDIDGVEAKDSQSSMDTNAKPKRKAGASKDEYALEVDLHGLPLEEAKKKVLRGYEHARTQGYAVILLRIITGKGRHSGISGAVLPVEIYDFVSRHFENQIIGIDESPGVLKLGGLPIKGHFDVRLTCKGGV